MFPPFIEGPMSDDVNLIKNPDFSRGTATPRSWAWTVEKGRADCSRDASGSDQVPGVIELRADEVATAALEQDVPCDGETSYRVEAVLSCSLAGEGGAAIWIEPLTRDGPSRASRHTAFIRQCAHPFTVRAYVKTPEKVKKLRIRVGFSGSRGFLRIFKVRCIPILPPDEVSHPLAVPLPPYAQPAPRVVRSASVCSETAGTRGVTSLLRSALGRDRVVTCGGSIVSQEALSADAILLPDAVAPRNLQSVKRLLELAMDHVVVVSLSAFARLAGGNIKLRRIEQDDDPIHAQVAFANYATRGFALHDAFPYAWAGKESGSFAQNQFRDSRELKAYCRRHGLDVLLQSQCDKDSTSEQPICLFRIFDRGALFVLDVEPVEDAGSSLGEPQIAACFLLTLLGWSHNGLGQFAVPADCRAEFFREMRDFSRRLPEWRVLDEDVPVERVEHQLITIGGDDVSYGLPLRAKPVFMIRSGLQAGDAESVYGVLPWLKEIVRRPPNECQYSSTVAKHLRLIWSPVSAAWESRDGLSPSYRPAESAMEIELDDADVCAVVDVTSHRSNAIVVTFAADQQLADRLQRWLPSLYDTFRSGRQLVWAPPTGSRFDDRDAYAWTTQQPPLVLRELDSGSLAPPLAGLHGKGAAIIGLQFPAAHGDFSAYSIHRTGLTATLLEHVAGLVYGLIAVNRTASTVQLDGFAPVAPGEALILSESELASHTQRSIAG